MPGGLTYGHDTPTSISLQLASLLRRRPRLSTTVFAVFLVLLILRLEWGWFRPRLGISLPSKSALDDEMLPLRVLRAEETYQKMLRSRKELIHRAGPEKDAVSAFPRDLKLHTLWDFFPPAFQCPHLVERVGSPGVGGKWVCGLDRLVSKRDCVIYSFGSSWEASFEAALLKRTKHCKFYGHHFDSKTFGPEVRSIDRLHWRSKFSKIGLSNTDEPPVYRSLSSIMFENGHDYVDLITIDIEGWEFAALKPLFEAYTDLPLPFGQLQLEIHAADMPFADFLDWWETLEKAGLRPFFSEPNLVYVNINKRIPELAQYSFLNIRGPNTFVSPEDWNSRPINTTRRIYHW